MKTRFHLSWSPAGEEATYSRVFPNLSEREKFALQIAPCAASIYFWER